VDDLRTIVPDLTAAVLAAKIAIRVPLVLYGQQHMERRLCATRSGCPAREDMGVLKGLIVSGRRAPQLPATRRMHHELTDAELTVAMTDARPDFPRIMEAARIGAPLFRISIRRILPPSSVSRRCASRG